MREVSNKRVLIALLAMLFLCAVGLIPEGQRDVIAETSSPSTADYAKFSHTTPREHADLMDRKNCDSCHRRGAGAAPTLPLHKDCTGCHMVQFTAANRDSDVNPICTICHVREGLNSSHPPTKGLGLKSFRAEFDHSQHLQGKEKAKPSAGCGACHMPTQRGVSQSIPAHLTAHQVCYECHSPGKQANDLSSCGVCHSLGPYSPTATKAASYRMSFSHADHTGRARLTCTGCHNVKARGLPQGRQVTSISGVQHFPKSSSQSCTICHNGHRAFGDADTHDCKRCHRREGFKMAE